MKNLYPHLSMTKNWILSLGIFLVVHPAWSYDTVRFLPSFPIKEAKKPQIVRAGLGRYYILDGKGSLLVYNRSGKIVPPPAKSVVRLRNPEGLAITLDKVYVADTGNSILRAYDRDGAFLFSLGAPGSQAGQFDAPSSIAIGKDGRIYVADTGNKKVEVFTPEGLFLFWFGTKGNEPGQWKRPDKIAVDASDRIYVLDSSNERIEEFDSSARYLRSIPFKGEDFAVDSYGFIYGIIADSGHVVEWKPDGSELGHFGSNGHGAGQFELLDSISIAPNGELVILDSGKKLVGRALIANTFKTHPIFPNELTKIFPSGPIARWDYLTGPIAIFGEQTYAYLPQKGNFVVLDSSGDIETRFGNQGNGRATTQQARGIAVSPTLGLYTSDAPDHRIQHFVKDSSGSWRWDKNIAEPSGWFDGLSKEGRIRNPQGIAINDAGTVYVADPGNHRVDAFTPDGVFLFSIGPTLGSYQLKEPVSVVWDKTGFVYFLDRELKKVFKCGPSGELVSSWGEIGEDPGKFEDPIALAFDGENYIYVLDHSLKRVSAFSENGHWMMDFFSGSIIGDPTALAVSGQVLRISDRVQGRILSFRIHPSLSAPVSISTSAKDGIVGLSWTPVDNSWIAAYRVYRSNQKYADFLEIARTDKPEIEDSNVEPGKTYYYRVASEVKTGDIGPQSRAVKAIVHDLANRSMIEISSVTLSNIFPANYKWYLNHPIGSATITNNSNAPFRDIKLTFRLKDYMDFGYDIKIEKLDSMGSIVAPLIATLNNKILEVTKETPIQANLALTYFQEGKRKKISLTKPLRVYSRNAITWQNLERIANFITPNDTPVFDFQRAVLPGVSPSPLANTLNLNVVTAMRLWEALGVLGVQHVENPRDSFKKISKDLSFPIDYAQFPRETLRRKGGQCNDLTTLLISMFDAANVRAAILNYPGHMAFMFDTGANSWTEASFPMGSLIFYGGTYWVPLESTLIGKPFLDAARNAAYSYATEMKKGDVQIIDVRKAWETYEPVTMPPTDWRSEIPQTTALDKSFKEDSSQIFSAAYRSIKKQLKEKISKDPSAVDAKLTLGIWEFEAGNIREAQKNFKAAIAVSSENAAAYNDMASVDFLAKSYHEAEKLYLKAVSGGTTDPDIWMNLLKTEIHLKNAAKAKEYAEKVKTIAPSYGPTAETLIKDSKDSVELQKLQSESKPIFITGKKKASKTKLTVPVSQDSL